MFYVSLIILDTRHQNPHIFSSLALILCSARPKHISRRRNISNGFWSLAGVLQNEALTSSWLGMAGCCRDLLSCWQRISGAIAFSSAVRRRGWKTWLPKPWTLHLLWLRSKWWSLSFQLDMRNGDFAGTFRAVCEICFVSPDLNSYRRHPVCVPFLPAMVTNWYLASFSYVRSRALGQYAASTLSVAELDKPR